MLKVSFPCRDGSIFLMFNTQICTLMSVLADAQHVFFQSWSYKLFFSSYRRSGHIVAYMLPAHD
jgi:ABC-type multidrug transport system permease subunit